MCLLRPSLTIWTNHGHVCEAFVRDEDRVSGARL